jgi:hypothetical protein
MPSIDRNSAVRDCSISTTSRTQQPPTNRICGAILFALFQKIFPAVYINFYGIVQCFKYAQIGKLR